MVKDKEEMPKVPSAHARPDDFIGIFLFFHTDVPQHQKGIAMRIRNNISYEKLKKIILTGVFTALSYVCLLLIRVPDIAGFLTLDVKDAVVTLGAMFLGPVAAVVISLLVSLIELITVSGTGFWGFLMNFLGTAVFSVLASLLYKYKKTLFGGIIGLAVGTVGMIIVMMLSNLFITPIYLEVPRSVVIDLLPTLLIFNSMKGVLNAAVVLFLYKPVSNALKATGAIVRKEEEKLTFGMKTLVVMLIAAAIAAGAAVVLVCCL